MQEVRGSDGTSNQPDDTIRPPEHHGRPGNPIHNLADLVRRAALTRPAHPALRYRDDQLTWADLDREVDGVAAGLAALGLPTRGHPARVVIALPNEPGFATTLFGALRAGLIVVPVNPGFTNRELTHILADCDARVLIASRDVIETVGAAAPPHTFTLDEVPRGGRSPAVSAGGDDVAVLLYTSGTVGDPRAAMLSHGALLANHEQLAALDPAPVGPSDVVLLVLPLFHAYGLNSGLAAVAYHAATGVLVERFDPEDTLDVIVRHGVTAIGGVPPMYVAWSLMEDRLAAGFRGVRVAVSGAAPLDPATARRFREIAGKPVHVGYGLTETAPVVTSTLASATYKTGSIGRAIPGVEVKLALAGGGEVLVDGPLDDDDFDDDSPSTPGTDPGEVVVRGPNLFRGYWPDGREGPGTDGWWATGDMAYADADGDLFLVDRLTELILVSGFNVYPHEVERVLLEHPAVAEVAVVGMPHAYTGEAVKAFVVRSDALTADELISYAERYLARFKCPAAVEFVDALPYSATGKIRKTALRDRGSG